MSINAIEVTIAKIDPKDGDTLVVMTPMKLTTEQLAYITTYLKGAVLESVKVIVLDGGLTLAHLVASHE